MRWQAAKLGTPQNIRKRPEALHMIVRGKAADPLFIGKKQEKGFAS